MFVGTWWEKSLSVYYWFDYGIFVLIVQKLNLKISAYVLLTVKFAKKFFLFFLGKYASFDINLKNGLIANRLYERRFFMWKFKEDFLLPFLFIICWRCRVLPLELNWKSSFEKKTFNKIFINLKIAFSKDNIGLKFDRKRFKLWTF